MNKIEYNDMLAFHPGYYINEIIEDMEMSQEEFAKRLDVTPKTLSCLVRGKANISKDLAKKLSLMLNTSVEMWLNLQQEYEKKIIEIEKQKELDEQVKLVKLIDYSYFVNLGFLESTKNIYDKIRNLCSFFRVSNLNVLLRQDLSANFRSGIPNKEEKNILNANAWLETAIKIAREEKVSPYNEAKLKSHLQEIRAMTVQDPEDFMPRLKNIFKECGVVLVLLPALKNSGINGAVKWLTRDKAVIAMNDRRKNADIFWFSIFHEIKHILQHKTTCVMLSGNKDLNQKYEEEADEFARDYLIPKSEYELFTSKSDFSTASIMKFSKKIGIHPGIVVGRLQKENKLAYNCVQNSLKIKYSIDKS